MTRRTAPTRISLLVLAMLAGDLLLLRAVAQYRPYASNQVNPRVNSALYSTASSGSIRYGLSSSQPMASELRHAYWQSGALPSDVRMNYAAMGPLADRFSYIPSTPSYQSKNMGPAPHAQGAGAYGMGTIRYGGTGGGGAPSSTMVSPTLMSAPSVSRGSVGAYSVSRGPMSSGMGSVRYR
jgi:hypothetical protein